MTDIENDARTAFELMGFNEEETGGGCTAWTFPLDGDREIMVTETESLCAVLDMTDPTTVAIVDTTYNTEAVYVDFDHAEQFIRHLDALCEKNCVASDQALEGWVKDQAKAA
jgi:hypothetical protein